MLQAVGTYLMTVDMFPVFFYVHFIISCIVVREDSKDLGPNFRQKHPLTSWICSLLAVFSGAFIASFLFAEPLIDILQENVLLIFFTIVWYLLNYSPGDIVFKISMSPFFMIPASVIHEGLRLRFVFLGLMAAAKAYPNSPLIILLGGVIKGNGYGFIRLIERVIRGKWDPKANELLVISYFTKSAVLGCIVLVLHQMKIITMPIEILYTLIFIAFASGRLLFVLRDMKDPFVPIEGPLCKALFGGWEHVPTNKPKDATKKNADNKKKN